MSKFELYRDIIASLEDLKFSLEQEDPIPSFIFVVESKIRAYTRKMKKVAHLYDDPGPLCLCGHTCSNHKMPGGVWGFKCIGDRNMCSCRKFKTRENEEIMRLQNEGHP